MLNRKATKKFILERWKKLRPGWTIDRVSKESLDILEARLHNIIIEEIKRHPSMGKTFRL